jgi:hypothetical protein
MALIHMFFCNALWASFLFLLLQSIFSIFFSTSKNEEKSNSMTQQFIIHGNNLKYSTV